MNDLRSRPVWGVAFGLLVSLVLACLEVVKAQAFNYDVALPPRVLGLQYFLGGALGGAVLGSLLPWARHAIGAALLGSLSALPHYLLREVALHGREFWQPGRVFDSVLAAVLVGGIAGYAIRQTFLREG